MEVLVGLFFFFVFFAFLVAVFRFIWHAGTYFANKK